MFDLSRSNSKEVGMSLWLGNLRCPCNGRFAKFGSSVTSSHSASACQPDAGVIGADYLGVREIDGIIISRRPKSLASTERAPGPRRTIATLTIPENRRGSVPSNKLHSDDGNPERAMPIIPNPTTVPTTDVRKPKTSIMPLTSESAPKTAILTVSPRGPARYSRP